MMNDERKPPSDKYPERGASPAREDTPQPSLSSTLLDLSLPDAERPSVTLQNLDTEPEIPTLRMGPNRYHIVERIGEGGMGEVFLAYDKDLRRRLALKTVRPKSSKENTIRFFSEAQVIGQLSHPNIVAVYELGLTLGRSPYYTMPLVQGQTLAEILTGLQRGEPEYLGEFSLTRLIQIFLQVTLALDYAHAKGVVHCDIKPSNVMLGEHGEVLLLDWGVAKVLKAGSVETDLARLTEKMEAMGTPLYMAPEQVIGGKVDARTDIYALGVMLYELLTLQPPFRGGISEVMDAHLNQDPVPPRSRYPEKHVPLALEQACLKALRKKPAERHASARKLYDEVQAWLEAVSDEAKRFERAGKLAVEGRQILDSYQAIKSEIRELESETARLRAIYKGWQTVEDKAPLFDAEDRVAEARRKLALEASNLVMTLSAALGQHEQHPFARQTMADYYWDRFVEAENAGDLDRRDYHAKLVEAFHDGFYDRQLKGDGSLRLDSSPEGAEVVLYELAEENLQLMPRNPKPLGTTPLGPVQLPMGSYLALISKEGLSEVHYPVWISRNRDWKGQVHLYTNEQIGDGYTYVPSGSFVLGGDEEAEGWCLPRAELELESFFIGTHPVTLGQYLEFLNHLAEQDPEEALRRSPRRSPDGGSYLHQIESGKLVLPEEIAREHHWSLDTPVVAVSWNDAVAYCMWRSEVEECEVRLPTEAEWEKASRGVDGRWFPWGRRFDASLCNMRSSLRQGARPLPIDAYPTDQSVYGVRGTAGNVRDWTATVVSDVEAEEADTRVVRGGAWNLPAVISRSANRFWLSPSFVLNYVGFRVARSKPGP